MTICDADKSSRCENGKRPHHIQIWIWLIALIALDWVIGRGFSWLVNIANLNNGTRSYYQTVLVSGINTAILNFLIHWLPQAIILFLVTVFVLARFRIGLSSLFGASIMRIVRWFIIGSLLFVCYHIVINLVGKRSLAISPDMLESPFKFVGLYIVRFLPSAFAEETVYRGGIFNILNKAYGQNKALVVSVLIFALGHGYGGWWLMANSIILGTMFTVLYLKTKSLLPGIIVHTISNVTYAILNY
ncbi:MAG: CPBP family intramembrane glutamic endopeptidase [Planctomycetota bacterium]